MKCPRCDVKDSYRMDRSPLGNTECLVCKGAFPTVNGKQKRTTEREKQLGAELALAVEMLQAWNTSFKSCVEGGMKIDNNFFLCLNQRYIAAENVIEHLRGKQQ